MEIKDLVTVDAIVTGLKSKDKKQLLQDLATQAARVLGLSGSELYEAVLQRERLGSTAVGRGVAIPHCRLGKVRELRCFFCRLDQPVVFDAPDGEPVDLVFLLVAPENAGADHLKALACISRTMRDTSFAKRLRAVKSAQATYSVFLDTAARPAA